MSSCRCTDDVWMMLLTLKCLSSTLKTGQRKGELLPSQARAERPGARRKNPNSGVPPPSGLFGNSSKPQTDLRAHLGFSL